MLWYLNDLIVWAFKVKSTNFVPYKFYSKAPEQFWWWRILKKLTEDARPVRYVTFTLFNTCRTVSQALWLARRSLSVSAHVMDLSPRPSVGLSGKYTVAKWLNGSRCRLGRWVGSPRHSCLCPCAHGGSRASRGRGCFGGLSAFATPLVWMGRMTYYSHRNVFDLYEKS